MKRITLYSLILVSTLFGSCKKFLEEYSQDEIRPGNISELSSLMYADAYPAATAIDNFDILTDDVQCNGPSRGTGGNFDQTYLTALQTGAAMFRFDPTMFDANNIIPNGANVYQICYSKIKGCNVVLDYIDKMSGTEQEKNAVRGQCLFLRSYYYLKLVTAYAQPYTRSDIDPATTAGVPLVLSSKVKDGGITRASIKAVYDQIEKDLLQAAELLTANYTPANAFRVGNVAAWTLLSRMYLYRGGADDLTKAIDYATLALAQNSSLVKLTGFVNANKTVTNLGLFNTSNAETIWVFGSREYSEPYFPVPTNGIVPPYAASTSLLQLYYKGVDSFNYGDLRYKVYFSTHVNSTPYRAQKFTPAAVYGARGLRVAELYLNRAEALIKRAALTGNNTDRQQALNDLNTLRESRYDSRSATYSPVSITDPAELYKFCQDERRRELCLEEGHRWVDLKRWGLPVTHVFTGTDGQPVTSTIAANSNLYALPLPYTAINSNSELAQNPR
ncbi:RagB/SusD family nutrient uptake outer membrane protein [Filimonas effusa]|uniref:RagB/SusD family nutrient uptake outer membrane protein n=1 Tax=Filimonas effusa TaxID=2508721 RepID=A0A4Q1DDL5_9BACT|nr:RagB/SusD family nutrient uptake outer membrane protein [Filimonas effusa]RXK87068.1 RagB/SusD family nutrient uptake outer membrane protein [Filimonas effusa]